MPDTRLRKGLGITNNLMDNFAVGAGLIRHTERNFKTPPLFGNIHSCVARVMLEAVFHLQYDPAKFQIILWGYGINCFGRKRYPTYEETVIETLK